MLRSRAVTVQTDVILLIMDFLYLFLTLHAIVNKQIPVRTPIL
jgi:hypothetical protein